jgi:hypothetical protein
MSSMTPEMESNRATDGTTQYGGEYLEVVAVKAWPEEAPA